MASVGFDVQQYKSRNDQFSQTIIELMEERNNENAEQHNNKHRTRNHMRHDTRPKKTATARQTL